MRSSREDNRLVARIERRVKVADERVDVVLALSRQAEWNFECEVSDVNGVKVDGTELVSRSRDGLELENIVGYLCIDSIDEWFMQC